jgi:CO dehydrogenase/acetyl-CoA synthase delta subunit
MHFEAEMPNAPVIAVEIKDRQPDDWSPLLLDAWGEAIADPAQWAKAAEDTGADLIQLTFSLTDADGETTTAESAVEIVRAVLEASGLPLMVFGPGSYW